MAPSGHETVYLQILLTLAVSAAAGLFLLKKRVPAGALIGAICASAVLTAVFHTGAMPRPAKTIAQLIAGMFIGCSATREDLRQLRRFYQPVLVVTASLVLLNILIGAALYLIGYSDLLTCLVCAIPGGIADVTLIATDLGADPSKVLLIHFCRLVVGVGIFPLLAERFTPPTAPSGPSQTAKEGQAPLPPWKNALHILLLAAAALLSWIGTSLNFPSAVILCSLISSLVLRLAGLPVKLPTALRRFAQILSGAYIGCLMDPAALADPSTVCWSLLITAVILTADAFLFGKWMQRHLHIPLREGVMMLSPAGASDIALISADLGLDSPRLALIQVFRLLISTGILPQLCLASYRLLSPLL